jgi:NADH dehydrogenase (ubiquinone) 1 beta subcomplex subunit 7
MANARLPLSYRDSCAHLLIPLNKCRVDEYYLPWLLLRFGNLGETLMSRQNERHSYEKCQYEEFKKRVAKMDEIRVAKGGARSN